MPETMTTNTMAQQDPLQSQPNNINNENKTRRVHFERVVMVVRVRRQEERGVKDEDIWFTPKDFEGMRKRDRKLVNALSKGILNGVSGIHGLETRDERTKRHARMKEAKLSVLLEQEKQFEQRDDATRGESDPEIIALAYSKCTRDSKQDALQRAKKNVKSLLDRVDRPPSSSSSKRRTSTSTRTSRKKESTTKSESPATATSSSIPVTSSSSCGSVAALNKFGDKTMKEEVHPAAMAISSLTATAAAAGVRHPYGACRQLSSRSPKRQLLPRMFRADQERK